VHGGCVVNQDEALGTIGDHLIAHIEKFDQVQFFAVTSRPATTPCYHCGVKSSELWTLKFQKKGGGLMDPEKIMDGLTKELNVALKAMAKAKDVNEKEVHSRIVKNLCESLGVFLNFASEMMPFDFDDDV
jgi:hypothetical protein